MKLVVHSIGPAAHPHPQTFPSFLSVIVGIGIFVLPILFSLPLDTFHRHRLGVPTCLTLVTNALYANEFATGRKTLSQQETNAIP
jgi:hypothetical protein